jgi:hypothetical protein
MEIQILLGFFIINYSIIKNSMKNHFHFKIKLMIIGIIIKNTLIFIILIRLLPFLYFLIENFY